MLVLLFILFVYTILQIDSLGQLAIWIAGPKQNAFGF